MIWFSLGLLIGFIIVYFIQLVKVKQHDKLLDEQEQDQKERIEKAKQELIEFEYNANAKKLLANNELELLANRKISLENEINLQQDFAIKHAETFYNSEMEKAKNKIVSGMNTLSDSAEREALSKQKDYLKLCEQLKNKYLQMQEDLALDFSNQIKSKREELDNLLLTLNFFKSCVDSATEENKRAKLELEAKNFYRIVISNEDIEEIKKIRSIEPYLRNKEVLNKVIWTTYYKNASNDLCNRVVNGKKTGIYKITNLIDGMVYVGQAKDISERFIQHIKRGIGADNPGHNKLYPVMYEIGVENFMFEIIEECTNEELNEKEKYWIDFYNGISFGYNLRVG